MVSATSTRTQRVPRHNFPRSCFSSVSSAVKRRFQDMRSRTLIFMYKEYTLAHIRMMN